MKYCPNCGTPCEDNANCCPSCGFSFVAPQQAQVVNNSDHTADFSKEDISENKLYAVIAYLFSIFGLLIASICVKDSAFVNFHKKNALKLLIIAFVSAFLVLIPILGWIAGIVISVIILVLRIIAIVNVFCNQAKDLPIIKALKFLD